MSDVELHFSRDEFAARLAKTRTAMEEKGVDLLIVTDPSNMNWLTGYDGWSFYVHQCVIMPPTGEPIWFGRGQDANGAKLTAYLRPRKHHRLSRPLRAIDRASPDGLPVRRAGRHGLGRAAHRRRDGQLLVLGRRLCRAGQAPAERAVQSIARRW